MTMNDVQIFQQLNQQKSAGNRLALNQLVLAKNTSSLQVYVLPAHSSSGIPDWTDPMQNPESRLDHYTLRLQLTDH